MLAIYKATTKNSEKSLRKSLQNAFQKFTSGAVVEIWKVGSTTNDKVEVVVSVTAKAVPKYIALGFTADVNNDKTPDIKTEILDSLTKGGTTALVEADNITTEHNKVIIKFSANVDLTNNNFKAVYKNNISKNTDTNITTLTLSIGDNKLDFTHYLVNNTEALTVNGTEIVNAGASLAIAVKGLPQVSATATPNYIADKLLEIIEITGKENNYKTEDLYDSLMLTTEGSDLLSLVKSE